MSDKPLTANTQDLALIKVGLEPSGCLALRQPA